MGDTQSKKKENNDHLPLIKDTPESVRFNDEGSSVDPQQVPKENSSSAPSGVMSGLPGESKSCVVKEDDRALLLENEEMAETETEESGSSYDTLQEHHGLMNSTEELDNKQTNEKDNHTPLNSTEFEKKQTNEKDNNSLLNSTEFENKHTNEKKNHTLLNRTEFENKQTNEIEDMGSSTNERNDFSQNMAKPLATNQTSIEIDNLLIGNDTIINAFPHQDNEEAIKHFVTAQDKKYQLENTEQMDKQADVATNSSTEENHTDLVLEDTNLLSTSKPHESLDFQTDDYDCAYQRQLPIIGKVSDLDPTGQFLRRLTWATNDNRIKNGTEVKQEEENDLVLEPQIYSNVMFLPDKCKGAFPKRYGPKRLGSRVDIETYEDNSVYENEIYPESKVYQGSTNFSWNNQSDQEQHWQFPLKRNSDNMNDGLAVQSGPLRFVDDHFALHTGCVASGVSNDFKESGYDYNHNVNHWDKNNFNTFGNYNNNANYSNSSAFQSSSVPASNPPKNTLELPVCKSVESTQNQPAKCSSIPKEIEAKTEDNEIQTKSNNAADNLQHDDSAGEFKCKDGKDSAIPDAKKANFKATNCDTESSKPNLGVLRFVQSLKIKLHIEWSNLRCGQALYANGLWSQKTDICVDNRMAFKFDLPYDRGFLSRNVCAEENDNPSIENVDTSSVCSNDSMNKIDGETQHCENEGKDSKTKLEDERTLIEPIAELKETAFNIDDEYLCEDSDESDASSVEEFVAFKAACLERRASTTSTNTTNTIGCVIVENNFEDDDNNDDDNVNDEHKTRELEDKVCGREVPSVQYEKCVVVKTVDDTSDCNEIRYGNSTTGQETALMTKNKKDLATVAVNETTSDNIEMSEQSYKENSEIENVESNLTAFSNQVEKFRNYGAEKMSNCEEVEVDVNFEEVKSEVLIKDDTDLKEEKKKAEAEKATNNRNVDNSDNKVANVIIDETESEVLIKDDTVLKELKEKDKAEEATNNQNVLNSDKKVANVIIKVAETEVLIKDETVLKEEMENAEAKRVTNNQNVDNSDKVVANVIIDETESEVLIKDDTVLKEEKENSKIKQTTNSQNVDNSVEKVANIIIDGTESEVLIKDDTVLRENVNETENPKVAGVLDYQTLETSDNDIECDGKSDLKNETDGEAMDKAKVEENDKNLAKIFKRKVTDVKEDNRVLIHTEEADESEHEPEDEIESENETISLVEALQDDDQSVASSDPSSPGFSLESLLGDGNPFSMMGDSRSGGMHRHLQEMMRRAERHSRRQERPHRGARRPERATSGFADSFYKSGDRRVPEGESSRGFLSPVRRHRTRVSTPPPSRPKTEETGNVTTNGNDTENNTEPGAAESQSTENGSQLRVDDDSDSDVASIPSSDDTEPETNMQEDLGDIWENIINTEVQKCFAESPIRANTRCTVLCLDISASMTGEPWQQMLTAVTIFIQGLKQVKEEHGVEDLVAVVTFGHETKVALPLTTDYNKVLDICGQLTPGGVSPMYPGIKLSCFPAFVTAYNRFDYSVCNIRFVPRILLISDGRATPSKMIGDVDFVPDDKDEEIDKEIMDFVKQLKSKTCLNIYCIPVGVTINETLLETISSVSGGKVVSPDNVRHLANTTYCQYHAIRVGKPMIDAGKAEFDVTMFKTLILTLYPNTVPDDMEEMITLIERYNKINNGPPDTDNDSTSSDQSEPPDPLFYQRESEKLPPLGTRVIMGPDQIDAPNKAILTSEGGTIVGHSKNHEGNVYVLWDSGVKLECSFGKDNKFNVLADDRPLPCRVEGPVKVGCKVRRGPDWQFGDQDGGSDQLGAVYDLEPGGVVKVRWPNGYYGSYRCNWDNIYDVVISDPDDPFGTKCYTQELNRRNNAKTQENFGRSDYKHEKLSFDLSSSLFGSKSPESNVERELPHLVNGDIGAECSGEADLEVEEKHVVDIESQNANLKTTDFTETCDQILEVSNDIEAVCENGEIVKEYEELSPEKTQEV